MVLELNQLCIFRRRNDRNTTKCSKSWRPISFTIQRGKKSRSSSYTWRMKTKWHAWFRVIWNPYNSKCENFMSLRLYKLQNNNDEKRHKIYELRIFTYIIWSRSCNLRKSWIHLNWMFFLFKMDWKLIHQCFHMQHLEDLNLL